MDYTLGRWLYRPNNEWKWFFSSQSQLIYQRHGHVWHIWRRTSRGGNLGQTPRFRYDTNGIQRPTLLYRATITQQDNNNIILTGWRRHDHDKPFTFQESTNTNWILTHSTQPNNLQSLLASIVNGTATTVSDSSFLSKKHAGASHWIHRLIRFTRGTMLPSKRTNRVTLCHLSSK
jgi:hypothetical protein